MNIILILFLILGLFAIIYYIVRFAIDPLIHKAEDGFTDNHDLELAYLKDIEVLSDNELKEVVEIYQDKRIKNEYKKYAKLLDELMNLGYFSYEIYSNKIKKLKKHFNIH